MKYYQRIIIIGISAVLFSCSSRKSLGGNYFYDESSNKVVLRYYPGESLLPRYATVPTKHPKSFRLLSLNYAVDKENVFWTGKVIENATVKGFAIDERFPWSFAKNTITNQFYYEDKLVDVDVSTVKILSDYYIADKNKVIYISYLEIDKYGMFLEVPVANPANFKLYGRNLGYDENTIYYKTINTKIPSNNAKIIRYESPTIVSQNDVLHFIYPNHQNKETIFKELPTPLKLNDNGAIDTFLNTTYYHLNIDGFKEVKHIDNSNWLVDENGLYFLKTKSIVKIEDQVSTNYEYDEKHPNYIKTTKHLIEIVSHPFALNFYPPNAVIVNKDIVKVGNTIYKKGKPFIEVDGETFNTLEEPGYVDKDFYYSRSLNHKQPIPWWAYQELLDGKNSNDLFGINTKYKYTTYKSYWNGFLVSLSVPTKQNDSTKIGIEFKNIERKKLTLSQPIEQQLHVMYKPHNILVYYGDENKLIKESNYDFKNIKVDESIQFSLVPSTYLINFCTVTAFSGQFAPPSLILMSNDTPLERTVFDLYLEADTSEIPIENEKIERARKQ